MNRVKAISVLLLLAATFLTSCSSIRHKNFQQRKYLKLEKMSPEAVDDVHQDLAIYENTPSNEFVEPASEKHSYCKEEPAFDVTAAEMSGANTVTFPDNPSSDEKYYPDIKSAPDVLGPEQASAKRTGESNWFYVFMIAGALLIFFSLIAILVTAILALTKVMPAIYILIPVGSLVLGIIFMIISQTAFYAG